MASLGMQVFVVPRWAGRPDDDFYPRLRESLADDPRLDRLEVLDMPAPDTPTIDRWVGHLRTHLDLDTASAARTVLVGHSVGCQAVIRYLAALPDGVQVHRVICVAGWWAVDAPWETLIPWTEIDFDLGRVRRAARGIEVLLSDDDPFTADHAENARLWRERLGAEVHLHPGCAHFNAPDAPEVIARIAAALTDVK